MGTIKSQRKGDAEMNRRDAVLGALRLLAPQTPDGDVEMILDHALHSPGLKKSAPETAAWLSLVAFVRHSYSDYDDLLADGYDVDSARYFCREQINEVLATWQCPRRVGESDDGEESN
jgi:hypothetical protein